MSGKWMFVGGCGGKIDILIILRTGVTIRKNLVTIRKKVAKGLRMSDFFCNFAVGFEKFGYNGN